MSNYRQVWEEANGPIPKGMHIHHILPRYMGGTDELENLQLVTPEEHYDIHFERGEYGAANLIQTQCIDRESVTKPVIQFDLEGHRIARFDTTTEADHSLGIFDGKTAVRKCATYTQKSFAGYQWFYESEIGDVDYVGPVERVSYKVQGNNTSRQAVLDTLTGIFYNSKREAARSISDSEYFRTTKEFKERFV